MTRRKYIPLWLVAIAPFIMAAALKEPLNTLLFLVAIPFAQQGIKLFQDKSGKTIGKLGNQLISLALAIAFTVMNGGFAGLGWPALPVFSNDLILFITDGLIFIGALLGLITAAWGSLMVLYESIWDRLFVKFEYATVDKLVG